VAWRCCCRRRALRRRTRSHYAAAAAAASDCGAVLTEAAARWWQPATASASVTLKCLPHEKSALGEIITELICLPLAGPTKISAHYRIAPRKFSGRQFTETFMGRGQSYIGAPARSLSPTLFLSLSPHPQPPPRFFSGRSADPPFSLAAPPQHCAPILISLIELHRMDFYLL